MITCWSLKGGSGTSVVAALLAVACARSTATLLVDADGDQTAIFGVPNVNVGFRDWWQASAGIDSDALSRLAIEISPLLRLIPSGGPMVSDGRNVSFESVRDQGMLIVDAGTIRDDGFTAPLIEASRTSLLVIRPCYLAARRVSVSSLRIDGLIVVEESGRVLRADDLAEVAGAPVVATLPWDSVLARSIDAGRVGSRLPRSAKSLEQLAKSLLATEVKHDH